MVIFNHHALHQSAAGVGAHFHRLHRAGNRCVDGNTQPLIVADLLTHSHQIALFHQGLAGNADVLGHRNHQNIRFRKILDRRILCVMLIFFRMDAAEKRKSHCHHLVKALRILPLFMITNHTAKFFFCLPKIRLISLFFYKNTNLSILFDGKQKTCPAYRTGLFSVFFPL